MPTFTNNNGGNDGIRAAFDRMMSNPNRGTEDIFTRRYRAAYPGSSFFQGADGPRGTGSMSDSSLASAAAALSTSATNLSTAAISLIMAANRLQGSPFAAGGGMGGGMGGGQRVPGAAGGGGAGVPPILQAFAGGGGFGGMAQRLLRLGATGGGAAGGIARGLAVAYALEMLPTYLGRAEMAAAAGAAPYIKLKQSAFESARAGGFSGQEYLDAISGTRNAGGMYQPPQWAKILGYGAQDLDDALKASGVNTPDPTKRLQLMTAFASSPAFANMPKDTAFKLSGFGETLGGGTKNMLQGVTPLLEQAGAMRLDKSTVLQHIEDILEKMYSRGSGLGIEQVSPMFMELLRSGQPGSRTGELQSRVFGGWQSAIEGVGKNPATTLMMASQVQNAGSAEQFFKNIGMGSEYAELIKNPNVAEEFKDIDELIKKGGINVAVESLSRFVTPSVMRKNVQELARKIFDSHHLAKAFEAQTAGLPTRDVYTENPAVPEAMPQTPFYMQDLAKRQGLPNDYLQVHDNDYRKILRARGISEVAIDAIMAASAKTGLNPEIIAATMIEENAKLDPEANKQNFGKSGVGLMQVTKSTFESRMGVKNATLQDLIDPYKNTLAGALELKARLERANGSEASAILGYAGGLDPNASPEQIRQAHAAVDRFENERAKLARLTGIDNLPQDVSTASAVGKAGELSAGRNNFQLFADNIDSVNTKFGQLGSVLDNTIQWFNKLTAQDRADFEDHLRRLQHGSSQDDKDRVIPIPPQHP